METWGSIFRIFIGYLILCLGMFLMLRVIVDYASFDTTVHFLAFKQEYLHITAWRVAFYVHVFTSILALMAGLTQFSSYLLERHRRLHRIIGRLYAIDILLINFPAGLIMAYYANGLWPSRIAFLLLDILWFVFTLKAVQAARQKRIDEHREFMIRSFALTFSAITLRTWKIVLVSTINPDPLTVYMMDAWLGFVPNLIVAEWWIRLQRKKRKNPATSEEFVQSVHVP